uniref:HCO3_cotransp domain-containing protein n=1 Tax=Macrostomum lignano TaxID=282301 RepID=A0A1I8FR82_9PLAT
PSRVRSRPAGQGGLLRGHLRQPLFCQLDQLNSRCRARTAWSLTQVWRKSFADKIRRELEVTGNRWSVPYVPVLSLFSVMEARRQLDSGLTLLMKVDSDDGPAAAGRTEVHRRGGRSQPGHPDWARTPLRRSSGCCSPAHQLRREKDEENAGRKTNKKYRKEGAQRCGGLPIMVGAVQTLRAPVSVFVRLEQPLKDEPLMEIDLPIRFLYLLLRSEAQRPVGPRGAHRWCGRVPEVLQHPAPIGCSLTDRIPPPMEKPNTEHRPRGIRRSRRSRRWWSTARLRGFQRTGRLFGGLVQDVKRRAPLVQKRLPGRADHPQTIGSFSSSTLPASPHHHLRCMLSDATNGLPWRHGEHTLRPHLRRLIRFVCWTTAHHSGIYGTGAGFLKTIVFKMCDRYHWTTCHSAGGSACGRLSLLLVTVALDLSYLVKYITRFTEESFALLIAVIFVYEALAKLFKISSDYP